jgi:hypothetical protein
MLSARCTSPSYARQSDLLTGPSLSIGEWARDHRSRRRLLSTVKRCWCGTSLGQPRPRWADLRLPEAGSEPDHRAERGLRGGDHDGAGDNAVLRYLVLMGLLQFIHGISPLLEGNLHSSIIGTTLTFCHRNNTGSTSAAVIYLEPGGRNLELIKNALIRRVRTPISPDRGCQRPTQRHGFSDHVDGQG